MTNTKVLLSPLPILLTALALTTILSNCSRSKQTEYASFVRDDKVEESKLREGNLKGLDIFEQEFGAGMLRFWPPSEIPPHPRDPKKPFVGKYYVRIGVINKINNALILFRLSNFELRNFNESDANYLHGRYFDKDEGEYREFLKPGDISGERINASKAGNGIELKLDIPKNVQSFDIAFEIEVEYQGKSETIKFEDHFVRSTYTYIPSG